MSTSTRSRTQKSGRTIELERRPLELEALEVGIASGLAGDDRSERERAEIGAGQPRRGAPAGVGGGSGLRSLGPRRVGRAASAVGGGGGGSAGGTPGAARPPRAPRLAGRRRPSWSMRRSIARPAAAGFVRLSGCRRIGGS